MARTERKVVLVLLVAATLFISVQAASKKKAGPPAQIAVASVTSSSVSLSWQPPRKLPRGLTISGYKLLFKLQGDAGQKKVDVPDINEYTISDLAAGSIYEVKMATITSNGKVGGFSKWVEVTTSEEQASSAPPNPPQNVRAQSEGTSISLEWTPPQDAFDGYVVSYGINSVDENSMEVGQEQLSTTLSGLQAGSSYQLALQSVRGGVRSAPLELTLQTGVPVASPPGTIRLRSTSDSIDVEWSHTAVAEEGVTGFELTVGPDYNPTEQTLSFAASDRFTTVTGLQPDQVYVVGIKAQNQYGDSQAISDKISTQAAVGPSGPSPPTGMQMRADTNAIEVYWGEPGTDIDYYLLEVGPASNPSEFSERVPSGTSNFRVENLQPGTDYSVSIRSVNSAGESQPLEQNIRTQEAQGTLPPSGMRMVARSNAIDVVWGSSGGDNQGYRLDVGPPSDPAQYSQGFPAGTSSHTVPDLLPNTEYQVSLVALSSTGESEPLTQVIRTMNLSPPPAISLQAAATTIDLQWPPSDEDVDGYNLVVNRVGRPDDAVYKETLSPVDVSHTITGLDPSTDYTVSLSAYKGDATSDPIMQTIRTIESSGTPAVQTDAPDSPNGVNAAPEGGDLRITWNSVSGATGYLIRAGRATSGAPDEVEERVGGRKTQYVLSNLEQDMDYLVSVAAINDAGESRPTMVSARTDRALPGSATGLTSEATSDSVTLTWSPPSTPIDGYILNLGTVTYPRQYSETLTSTDTSFTFRDLEPDTIYQAELQSYTDTGSSNPITAKIRTEQAPIPVIPETPGRVDLTASQSRVNIRWLPARGSVDGYRIRITDPDSEETNTVEVDQYQQSYAFTDLDPGKQYKISIEAFNSDGYSTPQVQTIATDPLPEGSSLPQNVDIVATGTRIDAHWNPPILAGDQNPHSYMVVAEAVDENGQPLGPRESITLHHSQTEHSFYDLQPATKYRVSVAANIDGTLTSPVVREVLTTIDGPIPPINVQAEPVSPTSVSVTWDFPVPSGPPDGVGGRRPDIYYTIRAANSEAGDIYANSREMTLNVDGLQPDTLYEVSVSMVFNGRQSDYGDRFAVRTFSDVDPRSPQFPTVTQVLLEIPENVHATINWLPPREESDNVRGYNLEYTLDEDPSLDNTTWASVSANAEDLGVVVSDLPTNGIITYKVQPVYRGGEKGPFTAMAGFSTPVAERPTPEDEPCQSFLDVTRQRINQITERVVPPLGMPLPFCDQFFNDYPCVWSPVCICIPRGTKSLGSMPTSVRPADGPGCSSSSRRRDDPDAMYRDEPETHHAGPGPCKQVLDQTLDAIKESHKNSMPLMGAALPNCKPDGYYDNIQCMGSMCLCVDELGQPTGKMTQLWNVQELDCSS